MLKKVLCFLVIFLIVCTSQITYSIPSDVAQIQHEYDEMNEELSNLQDKVQQIDNSLLSVSLEIDSVKGNISDLSVQMDDLKRQQDECNSDLVDCQDVLSQRLRTYYKNNNSTLVCYLTVIFSNKSFSDIIANCKRLCVLIENDKQLIKAYQDKKEQLNSLNQQIKDALKSQNDLLADMDTKKSDLESLKAQQQQAVVKFQEKQKDFENNYLSIAEANLVNPLISSATDYNQTSWQIQDAINLLQPMLNNQLKSQQIIGRVQDALNVARENYTHKKAEEEAERLANSSKSISVENFTLPSEASGSAVILCASQFLGLPYVWGGSDPSGFDCSGLVQWCFLHAAGVSLPRTTFDQINCGVHVDKADIKPGDLVFPSDHHVQIYVGNNRVIHAPQTGDVIKISEMKTPYEIRRIIN